MSVKVVLACGPPAEAEYRMAGYLISVRRPAVYGPEYDESSGLLS